MSAPTTGVPETDRATPIRVLVVEDNPADARLAEELLSESGYLFDVTHVDCLANALQHLKEPEVGCVLLDLGLPDSVGLDGIVRIREAAPEVPIVVLTGQDEDELALGALERGADDYLVKGYVEDIELARSIRHAVKRREPQIRGREAAGEEPASSVPNVFAESPATVSGRVAAEALNAVADPLFLFRVEEGPLFRCVMANEAALGATGFSREAVIGKNLAEIVPENEAALTAERFEGVIRTGQPIRTERTLDLPAGKEMTFEITTSPIFSEDGTCTHIVTLSRDVTQRKRAEHTLQLSEARYRDLFEAMPIGLYRSTPAGEILDVNRATLEISGYPDKESLLALKAIDGYVDPDERIRKLGTLEREGTFRNEFRVRRWDGTVIWVRNNARIVRDANGDVRYIEGTLEDITDIHRARAALAESQSLIQALLDHVPAAIWVKDLEYRYVMVNQYGAHQVGKEPSELIGKTDFEIYPEEIATAFRVGDVEVLESGAPYQLEEAVTVKGGGRSYLTIKFPIDSEDGSNFAVGGVSIDVHDRVQAEKELTEAASELKSWAAQLELTNLELRRANAELDQFANAVAHDLSEPLRTITSYIGLLARRYKNQFDSEAEEFVDFTVDGARRMQGLLDDVMTYSRARTGEWPVALVDSGAVVNQMLAGLGDALREAKATVTVDRLPAVWANQAGLSQVFQNLISNALKFRSRAMAPRIHISGRQKDAAWWFSVADNGIGIEAGQTERIFDMFTRLHTPEEYPGTGAGLAICKKIVQRQGGDIWVDSTPGEGSTFTFTLPLQNEHR